MTTKTYDEIVKEIKDDLQKMSNSDIGLQESIDLFEINLKKINNLKKQLEGYQMKVQKVLADNKLEDFEA
ncbi:exodeoxyribonuclease VII small subunit [Entomoplasma freundtii]|uniref:Exodeoxyribonuclease VII small subunit n=1 Tax=Entomoplasma freundtii TaxID=74700 RepID=A0A2K8NS08_9MOLU|nr:exodeoxyribonuclease VII small subunit [Entomoplasma freundtii]ATZ16336.1 exodeoxyribonuclease VII small subunit [Entomoplasma freundtii]TDY56625.1 exodeoxyribonuclease VII small subunit [Entomoplasma freundtii]